MNECFTIWQGVAVVSLTFGFTVFFDFLQEHARQLSMLRIIQKAWIQTFAHFMRCQSLHAGKLRGNALQNVVATFQEREHNVNGRGKKFYLY